VRLDRRTRMFEATDIREWRGHDVVDVELPDELRAAHELRAECPPTTDARHMSAR
jgi:hypothetical protein